MPDPDAPSEGNQDTGGPPPEAGHPGPSAPVGKARGPGRPRHPEPLEQHPVSVPGKLWEWTRSQPEGASGLVRSLLESERNRRSGAFYETSLAAGLQTMEVQTPFGNVTVLEMPGTGVMVLRDDDRHHAHGYLADKGGWRYTFHEDDLKEVLHARPLSAPEPLFVPAPAKPVRRARSAKRRKPVGAKP